MTETRLPVDPSPTTSVTAVVVTQGATPYLATSLAALAAQVRRPPRVLVVDVGPPDGQRGRGAPSPDPDAPGRSAAHDELRLGVERAFASVPGPHPRVDVVRAPGARTFGAAVRAALAVDDGPVTGWLWLLHDDTAPAPTALAELVRAVGRAPSVVVAGAKQRTWTDPERLLEVGLRTSRSGRRMTDVEPGELDQGQHDARDDVLGVGLAGALVRRDVWDELGGPDPALGPFGDGLDLSRRARLAGHRVVVVPAAVVRHAQAGYLGLRGVDLAPVDADGDGEDDHGDPARSFRARRRAVTHQRLVTAALPLLPVVVLLVLASSVVRALVQVSAKQPGLAVDELRGPLRALLSVGAVTAARRRAARTRRLPRRALWPLQAGSRDVWRQARDRRLARAEARRVVRAPSELELSELAALATRRRAGLAALVVVLLALVVLAVGSLVSAVAGGARLVGGALVPLAGDLGDLWAAATSWWVSGGLGAPGPSDALLQVMTVPAVLLGGPDRAAGLVVLGSVLLAGVSAWFAAGAATRSVVLRAWVALVWAFAPALLLGVGQGRLGPVVAHVLLPWVALGMARAVGVHRVDRVVSGVLTAQRSPEQEHLRATAEPDAQPDAQPDAEGTSASVETPEAHDPTGALPPEEADDPEAVREVVETVEDDDEAAHWVGAPVPTGSVTAAAAAALALAAAVAAAPALLVPAVLATLVAALCAPRHRRRLVAALLPALLVSAPLLVEAAGRGPAGLRLLVADPGLALATAPAGALERLLGAPSDASALVPESVPDVVTPYWPYALGAVVLGIAVLALLRGAGARAVRLGWVVAATGLAAATATALLPVGVEDGEVAYGWTGPALSLALLGLLVSAALGADGVRRRLAAYSFGWRQLVVGVVAVVAAGVPAVWAVGWAVQAHDGTALALSTTDGAVVPAVGRQSQVSPDASRVLALAVDRATATDGTGGQVVVSWQLLRADGAQLVDDAAAVGTLQLADGAPDEAAQVATPDAATQEVAALVARISQGATGDVAGPLAALAVSDVLVPSLATSGTVGPGEGPGAAVDLAAARRAREALVAELDATAGLERVTQNSSGVLWRVAAAGETAPVVRSWARTLPQGDDLADPAASATPVPALGRSVDTRVAAGDASRLLVLAERADPYWRATLDGRSLRAVDNGWRQTFDLGAEGGHLVVVHDPPLRRPLQAAQVLVLALTLLLALPVRRRRGR